MDYLIYLEDYHIRFLYNLLVTKLRISNYDILYNNNFNRSKIVNKIVHISLGKKINIKQILNDYNIHIFDLNYFYKLYEELNILLMTIIEVNIICNICLQQKKCKAFWKCNHYICEFCYIKWKKSCPMCRNEELRPKRLGLNSVIILLFKGYSYGYYMEIIKHLHNGFQCVYLINIFA